MREPKHGTGEQGAWSEWGALLVALGVCTLLPAALILIASNVAVLLARPERFPIVPQVPEPSMIWLLHGAAFVIPAGTLRYYLVHRHAWIDIERRRWRWLPILTGLAAIVPTLCWAFVAYGVQMAGGWFAVLASFAVPFYTVMFVFVVFVLTLGCITNAVNTDGPEPRCPACGYDLTANTSGVCPECGKTVAVSGAPSPSGVGDGLDQSGR